MKIVDEIEMQKTTKNKDRNEQGGNIGYSERVRAK